MVNIFSLDELLHGLEAGEAAAAEQLAGTVGGGGIR